MDKETIIKGCEYWVNSHKGENFLLTYSSVVELLNVLKEQNSCENCAIAIEDRQPIVRCKYCVNRHNSLNCRMFSEGMDTSDDWFCADGKHK